MQVVNHASVHRFRETVALSAMVEGAPTIYMEKEMAIKIAKAILACTKDINKSNFTGSNFLPIQLTNV